MGLAFLLLTMVAQLATATVASVSARAAASAAARAAALPGADIGRLEADLAAVIVQTIPGATRVRADIVPTPSSTTATASFRWPSPGPRWIDLRLRVSATVPVVVPP